MNFKKIGSFLLSSAMAFSMAFSNIPTTADAATVLTDSKRGEEDGYTYELWKDYGNTEMILNGNGTFSCSWNNINNCLFRTGRSYGCKGDYKTIDPIYIDYDVDYHPDGNSYLCVYGWTRSPLIEYYIVESWGTWRPPGGSPLGEITVDGATYDVYTSERINQPSIDGDTTFTQYWSVRREKRTSGVISVSKHFEEWEKMGLPAGLLYEAALNVEGYQSAGKATVLKNNFVNSAGSVEPTEAPQPATTNQEGYYFHSTFEDGKDSWTSRGPDKVEVNSSQSAAGNSSLYVSGRTESWNGVATDLSRNTFIPGQSYSFSVMAKPESGSENFKLTLQYSLAGEDKYDMIAEGTSKNGEWVQLANTSYTIPSGASSLLLYVETPEGTNSFYIDEAVAAPKGTVVNAPSSSATEPETSQQPSGSSILGDVNGDGRIDSFDIVSARIGVINSFKGAAFTTQEQINRSDVNQDGQFNVADLTQICEFVIGKITSFTKSETTVNPPAEQPTNPPSQPVDSSDYMKKIAASMVETEPSSIDQKNAGVDYGKLEKTTYYSSTASKMKNVNVLLPAGYNTNEKYPVLYVLHGIFGNQDSMLDDSMKIQTMLGNLVSSGEAEKMIVVFPSMFTSKTLNDCTGFNEESTAAYDNFLNDLTVDLMSFIEKTYSAKTGRDNTAITGFSMGGRESIYISISKPELFGYMGAACPAPGVTPAQDNFMVHKGNMPESELKFKSGAPLPYVFMISGARFDGTVGTFPQQYHNTLTANGVDHIWQEVANGDHGGNTVRPHMYNFLKSLFKAN